VGNRWFDAGVAMTALDQEEHVEHRILNTLKQLFRRAGDGIVQDVPPELDVCESCRKPVCNQEEWIVCENRIAHVKCLEAFRQRGGVA
jgi:hypothetical protein